MHADRNSMDLWQGRVDPEADSPRWHQRIQALSADSQPGVALLGFASDEGVRRNHGRVGAVSGPLAMRKALANLAWHRQGAAYDAGDVLCVDGDLESAQARLGHNVCALLDAGHLPIVLGGGHEVAFGSWQGIAEHLAGGTPRMAAPRIGIINFDAHFDLRDPAHARSSGTPFAQIAEQCAARGWPFAYACLGVSRASNTRALFQRAAELNVLVREDREIREASLPAISAELQAFIAGCDAIYLTIDIDVLPACEAPGVSAPAARGVPLALLEPLLETVRDSGKLRLADLAELNPEHDIDSRTARVAARLIHLLTLAEAEPYPEQEQGPPMSLFRDTEIRAARGTTLTAKSWLTEAPLRMLMNNLDPEVAENPKELVVYGGIGRAARNWECYDKIVEVLTRLEDNQTLLIQSGKPVGVFETHKDAPRVLLANSNLVPHWATWEHFNELDAKGLAMYGQMTAGSWIYIGSQGIVQGTYETFVEAGRQHYDGNLKGRWVLTAGLGGMGGAQPLAATLAGACSLNIECQQSRIDFRLKTRYVDEQASDLDDALARIDKYCSEGKAVSIALCGNAAEILPELVRRGVRPDMVTDQTSAHDPRHGYLPAGWSWDEYVARGKTEEAVVVKAAKQSMAVHVRAMLAFQQMGVPTFDYGNNIRQMALQEGVDNAFDFPGFVPAYIRPLFCQGIGPFRWVALSGDPEDIYKTDAKVKELIPDDAHLHNWLDMARERISFQGLPARICWVGLKDRARLAQAFNDMVASGELTAPIVIGRDHLDSGSVASPNRETESMQDGSDAVSDWPLLNALLNTAGGATWVSLHHGGGVGMGYSQHSGVVIVADGTPEARARLGRVLRNDPGTGVMRHADAGYDIAVDCAREQGLDLPMIGATQGARA